MRLPIRVGEQCLKAKPSASEVFFKPEHTALIPRMWPQLTFSLPLQRVWEFFSAENEPHRRRFGRNRSLLRDSSAAVSMLKVESSAAAIAERFTQNIAKKRDGTQVRKAQKLRGFLTIVACLGLSLYLHSRGRLAMGSVPANHRLSYDVSLKDAMRFLPKNNLPALRVNGLSSSDKSWLARQVSCDLDLHLYNAVEAEAKQLARSFVYQADQEFIIDQIRMTLGGTPNKYKKLLERSMNLVNQWDRRRLFRGSEDRMEATFEWRSCSNPRSMDYAYRSTRGVKSRLLSVLPLIRGAYGRQNPQKSPHISHGGTSTTRSIYLPPGYCVRN